MPKIIFLGTGKPRREGNSWTRMKAGQKEKTQMEVQIRQRRMPPALFAEGPFRFLQDKKIPKSYHSIPPQMIMAKNVGGRGYSPKKQ